MDNGRDLFGRDVPEPHMDTELKIESSGANTEEILRESRKAWFRLISESVENWKLRFIHVLV